FTKYVAKRIQDRLTFYEPLLSSSCDERLPLDPSNTSCMTPGTPDSTSNHTHHPDYGTGSSGQRIQQPTEHDALNRNAVAAFDSNAKDRSRGLIGIGSPTSELPVVRHFRLAVRAVLYMLEFSPETLSYRSLYGTDFFRTGFGGNTNVYNNTARLSDGSGTLAFNFVNTASGNVDASSSRATPPPECDPSEALFHANHGSLNFHDNSVLGPGQQLQASRELERASPSFGKTDGGPRVKVKANTPPPPSSTTVLLTEQRTGTMRLPSRLPKPKFGVQGAHVPRPAQFPFQENHHQHQHQLSSFVSSKVTPSSDSQFALKEPRLHKNPFKKRPESFPNNPSHSHQLQLQHQHQQQHFNQQQYHYTHGASIAPSAEYHHHNSEHVSAELSSSSTIMRTHLGQKSRLFDNVDKHRRSSLTGMEPPFASRKHRRSTPDGHGSTGSEESFNEMRYGPGLGLAGVSTN
ncbi:hypothetical protein HDU76_009977, partial [Blyttiomyces sp. JEL0837]